MKNPNYYTVYRDDELLAFGTAQECTDILCLKDREQFYALVSKSRSGLRRHYHIIVDNDQDDTTKDEEK